MLLQNPPFLPFARLSSLAMIPSLDGIAERRHAAAAAAAISNKQKNYTEKSFLLSFFLSFFLSLLLVLKMERRRRRTFNYLLENDFMTQLVCSDAPSGCAPRFRMDHLPWSPHTQ